MVQLLKNIFLNDILMIVAFIVVLLLIIVSTVNKDVGKVVLYSFSLIFIIAISILKEILLASDKKTKKDIGNLTDELNNKISDKIEVIKDTSSEISNKNNEIKSEVSKIEEKINEFQNNLNNNTADIEKSKQSMEDKIKTAGFSELQ